MLLKKLQQGKWREGKKKPVQEDLWVALGKTHGSSNFILHNSFSLKYGSRRTIGGTGGQNPTYVYPKALKQLIRARYPSCVKNWDDPTPTPLSNVRLIEYRNLGLLCDIQRPGFNKMAPKITRLIINFIIF